MHAYCFGGQISNMIEIKVPFALFPEMQGVAPHMDILVTRIMGRVETSEGTAYPFQGSLTVGPSALTDKVHVEFVGGTIFPERHAFEVRLPARLAGLIAPETPQTFMALTA